MRGGAVVADDLQPRHGDPASWGPCIDASAEVAPEARVIRVGDIDVTALLDSVVLCDARQFLPLFGQEMLLSYGDAAEAPLVRLPTTCFLARSGSKNILFDTGIGNRGRSGEAMGYLDRRLREIRVAPEDIDLVVNTHMHNDHVGWNTVDDERGTAVPFFPSATFLFQAAEADHWLRPERIDQPGHQHLRQCVMALAEAGKAKFCSADESIDRQINFVSTPGHTPGHVAIGIYSAGERAMILGDVTHYQAQLDHPEWSPVWDTDPKQSAATRQRMFEELSSSGSVVAAGHWPYPGFGRILQVEHTRIFQAV